MSNITMFEFNSQQVRVLLIEGDPWFIAGDICKVLEHTNPSQACARLDEDEKLISPLVIAGQNRDVVIISESGLYSLVLTSRKPEARAFNKGSENSPFSITQ